MNQFSRQKAKLKVEKDFYKLMSNSSFDYDCRNNIDNCNFKSIFEDIDKMSYIQYTFIFLTMLNRIFSVLI